MTIIDALGAIFESHWYAAALNVIGVCNLILGDIIGITVGIMCILGGMYTHHLAYMRKKKKIESRGDV